jgi:hypothetical protein
VVAHEAVNSHCVQVMHVEPQIPRSCSVSSAKLRVGATSPDLAGAAHRPAVGVLVSGAAWPC